MQVSYRTIRMTMYCDSHCHPSSSKFNSVLDHTIQEAKSNGLLYVIGVAEGCILRVLHTM